MKNVFENKKTGPGSIRLGGLSVDNLPIAESALTKFQMKSVEENEIENRVKEIFARFPPQPVKYLESRIRECRENIVRINKVIGEQNSMISQYAAQITMCEYRDKELAKTDDPAVIKELKLKYPPYSIPAMEQQIVQCREAVERCNDVIHKEHGSIEELTALVAQCQLRDQELKQYNVTIE